MHRLFTRLATALVAAIVVVGIHLAAPGPTVACSCMPPQPMAAYAGDPNQVIFAGTTGAMEPRGVPVLVTRWFQGAAGAAVVYLSPDGFGEDGASCGTRQPPPGGEWIFVAWKGEDGALGVNLCTPHATLASPEGQAMLADATATFGEGVVPGPDGGGGADDGPPIGLVALVVLGILVVAGVLLVSSRPRDEGSTAP